MTWIRTWSGKRFDFAALAKGEPVDLDIHDIAAALSRISRFGGHLRMRCSVAEHSVRVFRMIRAQLSSIPLLDASACLRAALLHDAPEAYLGDVVGPLKDFLPDYRALESKLEDAIFERFGCYPNRPDALARQQRLIKQADIAQLAVEMRDCVGHVGDFVDEPPDNLIAFGWDAATARSEFLAEAERVRLL